MKLRLFVVYPTNGVQVNDDIDLAILTEMDTFFWLETLKHIDILVSTVKRYCTTNVDGRQNNACREILDSSSKILDKESIHIIGDFIDHNELTQWLQMQHLLDNLDYKTIHTLTK